MSSRGRILVLGERVYDKTMAPERVARWKQIWEFSPVRAVLTTGALVHGPSRRALEGLVGPVTAAQTHLANLLWPDSVRGSWDRRAASTAADALRAWLAASPVLSDAWGNPPRVTPVVGVVLLGRRVTWGTASFGRQTSLGSSRVISLPHPAGLWHAKGRMGQYRDRLFREAVWGRE